MIMKLLKNFGKLRGVVLFVMLSPLLTFYSIPLKNYTLLPENPFLDFVVELYAPSKMAKELEKKVTTITEKSFNGLSGLISLESVTVHEKVKIFLKFDKGSDPNKVLLFIQEKVDQLKVVLPSFVESIQIDYLKKDTLPEIRMEGLKHYSYQDIKNIMKDFNSYVVKTSPSLDKQSKILITPNPLKLFQNNISLDQFGKSLKLSGLTFRLGNKDDTTYLLDGDFRSLEKIQKIVVGVRGHRPITLKNVASVTIEHPKPLTTLNVWIDSSKTNSMGFKEKLNKHFPLAIFHYPQIDNLVKMLKAPLTIFFLIMLLQILLFYVLYKHYYAILSIFVFNTFYSIQFFFWDYQVFGYITSLDLPSYFLGLLLGTIFWAILLSKIRQYFLPSKLENFIQRTLEQAKYFAVYEFIPTFLTLLAVVLLAMAPILLGNLSLPSQHIAIRFGIITFPLLIFILIIMALFSPLEWIETQKNPKLYLANGLVKKVSGLWMILVGTLTLLTFIFWDHFPYGINNKNESSDISIWRGHTNHLNYYLSPQLSDDNFVESGNYHNKQEFVLEWNITPLGLKYLMEKDLAGFQQTLQELGHHKRWGLYSDQKGFLPLHYSMHELRSLHFKNLLIGSTNKDVPPVPLGSITQKQTTLHDSQIFRGQLDRQQKGHLAERLTEGNFLYSKKHDHLLAGPMNRYFKKEFKNFFRNHWVVVLFLFVLLGLYLNSFFRGLLLTLFSLSFWKMPEIFNVILGLNFHLDSLWLSFFLLWIPLLVTLPLCRMVDIERLRGNDKDKALMQMIYSLSGTVFICLIFISLSLIIWWSVNFFMGNMMDMTLTKELLIICASASIVSFFSYFILFPLFYNTSEEFIDHKLIFFMKRYYAYKIKKDPPN